MNLEQMEKRYVDLHAEHSAVIEELNNYRTALIDATDVLKTARVADTLDSTTASKAGVTKAGVALDKVRKKEKSLFEDRNVIEAAIESLKNNIAQTKASQKSARLAKSRPLVLENVPLAEQGLRDALAQYMVWRGLQDGIATGQIEPKSLVGQVLRGRPNGLSPEVEAFKTELRTQYKLEGVVL